MKRFIFGILILFTGLILFSGCSEEYTVYEGPSYTMFSDTLFVCPAMDNNQEFSVDVVSLSTCDYDRNYAIEVIANQSNAVYNVHYKLASHSVTIPAGGNKAVVTVQPIYANIEDLSKPLSFKLRLVSSFDDKWEGEENTTKVLLRKVCPLNIYDFTGYCRVTSAFLSKYTGKLSRVFTTEVVEGEENMLLLKDYYDNGYSVKVRFDATNPLKPTIKFAGEQVIADTRNLFASPYGNSQLLASDVPGYVSTFDACKRKAALYVYLRVDDFGTVGAYGDILEWIEEYEAK